MWEPERSAILSGDAADDGRSAGRSTDVAAVGYYPEVHECTAPFSWTLTPHCRPDRGVLRCPPVRTPNPSENGLVTNAGSRWGRHLHQ
jgi:hypothetical protein